MLQPIWNTFQESEACPLFSSVSFPEYDEGIKIDIVDLAVLFFLFYSYYSF